MDKYKLGFMLGKISSVICIKQKIQQSHIFALHLHLDQGNGMIKGIDCL